MLITSVDLILRNAAIQILTNSELMLIFDKGSYQRSDQTSL